MRGLPPETLKRLILSVGTHRRDRPLSPVEVAEVCERAVAAGASLAELAQACQFDGTTMISRFLRLLKLSSEVRHLVDWGQGSDSTVGFTAASQLSRLVNGNDQVLACHAALEHRLTSKEIEQAVQLRLRSRRPMGQCVHDVLEMRPRVERRHLLVGGITSDAVRRWLSGMTQAERDKVFAAVLLADHPEARRFGARLGVERFTITGDESMTPLVAQREALETRINARLAEKAGQA